MNRLGAIFCMIFSVGLHASNTTKDCTVLKFPKAGQRSCGIVVSARPTYTQAFVHFKEQNGDQYSPADQALYWEECSKIVSSGEKLCVKHADAACDHAQREEKLIEQGYIHFPYAGQPITEVCQASHDFTKLQLETYAKLHNLSSMPFAVQIDYWAHAKIRTQDPPVRQYCHEQAAKACIAAQLEKTIFS